MKEVDKVEVLAEYVLCYPKSRLQKLRVLLEDLTILEIRLDLYSYSQFNHISKTIYVVTNKATFILKTNTIYLHLECTSPISSIPILNKKIDLKRVSELLNTLDITQLHYTDANLIKKYLESKITLKSLVNAIKLNQALNK